jgi:hypothetical protein
VAISSLISGEDVALGVFVGDRGDGVARSLEADVGRAMGIVDSMAGLVQAFIKGAARMTPPLAIIFVQKSRRFMINFSDRRALLFSVV